MSKSYVIISDTQIPYEDKGAMRAVIKFIGEYQPDEVVHIGDLMDYPQPARFSKGAAEEFSEDIFVDSEKGKQRLLQPLRAVYSGPVGVIEGNHDLRPRTYLARYAPALAASGAFNFDVLLDFAGFEIQKLPEFYEFAPGWLMTHGHKGGITISRNAAVTALNAAKRFNKSVIMGHTHRLGINHYNTGYDGRTERMLTGMEVGNLMDQRQATYLKGATANWQQGFGLVHQDGSHVRAETVHIQNKKFVVDGQTYSITRK